MQFFAGFLAGVGATTLAIVIVVVLWTIAKPDVPTMVPTSEPSRDAEAGRFV